MENPVTHTHPVIFQKFPRKLPIRVNLFSAKNHLSPDWYATSLNPWHEEAQPGTVINIDSLILQFPGPSYKYIIYYTLYDIIYIIIRVPRRYSQKYVIFILLTLSVSSKKIDGSLAEIIPVIYFTEQNYLKIMPIWNSI